MSKVVYEIRPQPWPRMPTPTEPPMQFASAQEFKSFLEDQERIWEFLRVQGVPSNCRGEVSSSTDHLSHLWQMKQECDAVIEGRENAEEELLSAISGRFNEDALLRIVTSKDDVGKLLLLAKDRYGDAAAAFAMEFYHDDAKISMTPDAPSLAAIHLLGDPALAAPALATQAYETAARKFDSEIAAAKQELEKVRAQKDRYNAEIELRAAAEYWNLKSEQHSTAAQGRMKNLKQFFAALIVAVIVTYGLLFWMFDFYKSTIPTSLYAVFAAGGLSVLAAVFWIGRIVVKLYMAEHQQREDAKERVVMTKTYLALISEKAIISDTDRQIILTALFKSAPVLGSDDGPPEIGIAALLGKVVAK